MAAVDSVYLHQKWNRSELKTLAIMRRRYDNIALARKEVMLDLETIAALGDMIQEHERVGRKPSFCSGPVP